MKINHEINDLDMLFKPQCEYTPNKFRYFHWHENVEFLYILSDGFKILIDGIMYEPGKGDLIFIGEYSVHCFICEDKSVHLNLGQVSLSILSDGYTGVDPIKTHITAEEIAKVPQLQEKIMHLTELMRGIGSVCKKDKNLFAKAVFSAFYFLLMENFSVEKRGDTLKKERKEFYRIIGFINENITENITVSGISKSLYLDRGKLSRIFTKYSGMSVNDYINRLRVSKANGLLEEGYTVMSVALESGFQSVRTFNNVYKKIMGFPPSQYK